MHDLVFSLGPNCKNAWNVRSHFGVRQAYPFDWWITPARAMLRMIEPGFVFHVAPDDLALTPVDSAGDNSVFNRRLNILQHHDFPRQGRLVTAVTEATIAQLNAKYAALFARMHAELAASRAPLALLNGSHAGWSKDPAGQGGLDPALNRRIPPAALIAEIRARLGAKLRVVVITKGEARQEEVEGGVIISRPDTGERHRDRGAPNYAEPVHVFRACYEALGLGPAA